MVGVQTWKAPRDHADRGASLVGHPGHLAGRISPWGPRWRWWPLVLRCVPGLQGARQGSVGATVETRSVWEAALAAILEGTRCWGEAPGRVGADASDSTAPLLNGWRARGSAVLSRLRTDAVGWDDPQPRPPGTRGRQPPDGRTWPLASGWTAATPTRARLPLDGKLTEGVCVVRDVWRRAVPQKVRVVVLEGAKEPRLLVRTDWTRSALQMIDLYGARLSIALTRRDVQPHVGLGDDPWTTTLALLRLVPLACGAFCLWRLPLLEPREAGWLQVTSSRGALPEAPWRFQRVRRALRAWVTRQGLFAQSARGADWAKSERDPEPLLHMLM
jgi:hypothetical protein